MIDNSSEKDPAAGDPTPGSQPETAESALDRLTNAFAELMGQPSGVPAEGRDQGAATGAAEDSEETAVPVTPQSIVEAMLFVGNRDNAPLTSRQMAELIRDVEPDEVDQHVQQLNRQYALEGRPYKVVSQGAGYRLILRQSYDAVRQRFLGRARHARLSQAAIDVLAIVAYHQPLTAEEVAQYRGRPSKAVLSQLVRRQLLSLERPEDDPRHPRYRTTGRFLNVFEIDDLGDLPQAVDVQ